jgi:hypothetical protein
MLKILYTWAENDSNIIMFNPTFNNISVISWRSVILVEDRRDKYPITSAVFTYRLNRLKPRASVPDLDKERP